MNKNARWALSAMTLVILPVSGQANENDETQLDEITVEERAPLSNSERHLSEKEIVRKPKGNGSITELLRNNPAVQFSDTARNSANAGEIAPEIVSFYGEPYYNNQFVVDGLSNNDIMNPGASNGGYKTAEDFNNPAAMYLAPGSPEAFYVDSSLLKDLTVYDRNVPAKYTDFTGGVIDAQLKDASTARHSGSISYRTTRDNWTKFQLSDNEQENFDQADATSDVHPKFVKHIFNLTVNQPLSDRTAALFSYNRTQSKMPEYHSGLNLWQKERRLAQTLMTKITHQFRDNHRLAATFMYSPHKDTFFLDNSKNGRYTSTGGGWRFNLASDLQLDWGKINTLLGYQFQRNRLAYDAGYTYYNWQGPNTGLDWCSTRTAAGCQWVREGGLGELNSETHSFTLKQDYILNTLKWGGTEHNLNLGWQAVTTRAHAERPHTLQYFSAIGADVSVNVGSDCTYCLPNVQYANRLIRYPAYDVKLNVSEYSAYFSDDIFWNRMKISPGVNISYETFLKQLNIAPRFSFNYDVFNDTKFNLTGGINRYYAGTMLAYALRSKIGCNMSYTRTQSNGEWKNGQCANNSVSWANANNLKTPYSDEVNLGFNYTLDNQGLNFNWVHRKSRRQFVPATLEDQTKVMSNDGKGQNNTFTLEWRNLEPYRFNALHLNYRVGVRYQHRNTNYHGNYDESLVSDIANARYPYYLFEGKRYNSINDLPPFNFNRPWEGYLELQTDFPRWHLRWTHTLNVRSGYKNYLRYAVANCADSSQPQACGDHTGGVYDYRLKKYKTKATLDWRLLWAPPISAHQRLEFSVDVLNVFNSRIATSSTASTQLGGSENQSLVSYEMGRQFWIGVTYYW
ncbi:hypothetical protein RYD26_06555 [Pasteurellaceae bacterium LIM206]|nr:hypothetical protein [Pasteurellaceae bacterium LIM206]